ncbi:hypothetical protein J27TS7_15860 [Paenibacillus dendritiformis]|nr:hypothetical protein J27TS7_15860 [Paenibacillus dendritiformis]
MDQPKKMLWWQITEAVSTIEKNLKSKEFNDADRELEFQKYKTIQTIILSLGELSNLSEKSKLRYEMWINKSTGRNSSKQAAKYGITTDSLRSKIIYFDNKLRVLVGDQTIASIVSATSVEQLVAIMNQFIQNAKERKGVFM